MHERKETMLTIAVGSLFVSPIIFFFNSIQPTIKPEYVILVVLSFVLFVSSAVYLNKEV